MSLFNPFDKTAAHFFLCPKCREKVLASYEKSLDEKEL